MTVEEARMVRVGNTLKHKNYPGWVLEATSTVYEGNLHTPRINVIPRVRIGPDMRMKFGPREREIRPLMTGWDAKITYLRFDEDGYNDLDTGPDPGC